MALQSVENVPFSTLARAFDPGNGETDVFFFQHGSIFSLRLSVNRGALVLRGPSRTKITVGTFST